MPACGYAEYAQVMQTLPGTAKHLIKRTGIADMRRLLNGLWALGLVHPGGRQRSGKCSYAAVWKRGEGPAAEGLRLDPPKLPRGQLLAFKYLWRALEDGATQHELAELTGCSGGAIRRVLRGARVYICEYERDSRGYPVAVWKLGTEPDKPRPQPIPGREKTRRYRQRKVWRVLAQQGVVA